VRTRSRWVVTLAVAAAIVAAVATGALARTTVKPPSGQPWIIYNIADEQQVGGALAQVGVGMRAAADYVNKELGGLKGRPIEIDTCNPNLDPAATTACANKAVEANPLLVGGYSLLFGQNAQPVIEKAGLPMMVFPAQTQQLSSASNFPLGGGIATAWPIMAKYLANVKKVRKVSALLYDTASNRAIIHLFFDPLRAKNANINEIYFPIGTADFTPQAVKATSSDPDIIYVGAAGADAVRIYTALKQAGWPANKIWNTGTALDKDNFFDKAGSAADGAYFTDYFTSFDDLTDPQVKLYRAKIQKYGGVHGESQNYQWGFSTVMTAYNASQKIKKLSAATLLAALQNGKNVPVYMGAKFVPKKDVTVDTAGIRQPLIRLVQWKGGKLVNVTKGFISFK
jgi:branched-chain amino acid transport system substrate-binding protein